MLCSLRFALMHKMQHCGASLLISHGFWVLLNHPHTARLAINNFCESQIVAIGK